MENKENKDKAMEEFYNFYHTTLTKSEFESKMEDIMSYYNAKMTPNPKMVAAVLGYCRNKLLIKPPATVKNDLTWLRLATTKNPDPRYDLSCIKYDGVWSYATDGKRCHAVKRQINPNMLPGDKLTKKNEILTPTPNDVAKYMDFEDVIKDCPDIDKLMLNPKEMVEVNLIKLPDKTYTEKNIIIDSYQVESRDPAKRLDGMVVKFNRQYYGDATSYIMQSKIFMSEGRYMSPVIFIDKNYMALVMPTK